MLARRSSLCYGGGPVAYSVVCHLIYTSRLAGTQGWSRNVLAEAEFISYDTDMILNEGEALSKEKKMDLHLNFSPEEEKEIRDYARAMRVRLQELVELQVKAWLATARQKFSSAGPCPSCSLRGVQSELKGMPILEAEHEGLIRIGPRTNRNLITGTQYVVCPKCLWWGFPNKKE